MSVAAKVDDFLKVFDGCEVITSETNASSDLVQRFLSKDALIIKFGVDPTATELHLGWMVSLIRLRKLQDLGHKVTIVMGDFTAQIGDPSGKSVSRKQLDKEDIRLNSLALIGQFENVLDMSSDKLHVFWNSALWEKTSTQEFLEMCSSVTVAQILERKDFDSRLKSNNSIGLHEILYPVIQGNDSLYLQCDVELGGADQRLNCLFGRDVMMKAGVNPQAVILTPLLTGWFGTRKMSQSLGNFISIRDEPTDMFGKVMSIPDELILNWWELLMFDGFLNAKKDMESGVNPKDLKLKLAFNIVEMCHNEYSALFAMEQFNKTFTNRNWQETAPEMILSLADSETLKVYLLLVELGFALSNSEAKRLIESGAVEFDGNKIDNVDSFANIGAWRGKYLKVGKRRFAKLI
jgi:tyrosyl-tRNA synthetase